MSFPFILFCFGHEQVTFPGLSSPPSLPCRIKLCDLFEALSFGATGAPLRAKTRAVKAPPATRADGLVQRDEKAPRCFHLVKTGMCHVSAHSTNPGNAKALKLSWKLCFIGAGPQNPQKANNLSTQTQVYWPQVTKKTTIFAPTRPSSLPTEGGCVRNERIFVPHTCDKALPIGWFKF